MKTIAIAMTRTKSLTVLPAIPIVILMKTLMGIRITQILIKIRGLIITRIIVNSKQTLLQISITT